MGNVVVTLTDGKGKRLDLEIPADVSLSTLAPALARVIDHKDLPREDAPVKFVVRLERGARVLPSESTLRAAGVVHGDILHLAIKPMPPTLAASEVGSKFGGPGLVSDTGRAFPFQGDKILIGRVDRASGITQDILGVDLTKLDTQDDPSVSRRHAQVLRRSGSYVLSDLGSTNGTMINGQALQSGERIPLKHGDRVQFGDVELYFVWDSQ
jgi:uncharacterized ubiquitin-like protein YukD